MFRFTIREWLLLTLVVAIVVAWWIDRSVLVSRAELSGERAAVLEAVMKTAGWTVKTDRHGIHISR